MKILVTGGGGFLGQAICRLLAARGYRRRPMMQFYGDLILILDSTVRLAVPLIFACLAGLYSERAGIVDIGLEGKLLGSAFGAAAVAAVTARVTVASVATLGSRSTRATGSAEESTATT